MKDFLFLISFALVYWGYNTDHLLLSVIFAFVLEIHRFIKFRWDFTEKDFNYISMISTIISAGYIIYYVNSTKQLGIISSILQFLPIILFPLNFFYLYSSSTHVNAKRLFLLFVVNKYSVVHPYIRYFRPDYFYFTTVILGGSVKGSINSFYFVVALLIPVLIKFRSRNHSITRFAFSIASVLLLSLIMQSGIYNSFYLLRDFLTDLYIEKFMQNKDRSVQIGNIGSLKDNFRIEIRTEIFHEIRFGILLRDRIFNSYFNGNWTEIDSKNSELKNTMFEYGSFPIDSVRIYFFSRGKTDYIKMPFGTFDFAGIETGKANLNSLGAVSANYTQYLIDYKTYIRKDSLKNLLGNPDESDLKFIKKDSVYTDNLIDALNLKSLDAAQVFSALRNYFIKNYRYSLDYIDWNDNEKLDNFIQIKQGHCELFATLSCLIYRRLGFPSRYVTGYYISEYNEFEEKYIGRKKDRHAWIFVWDNKGNWREFDPTPPDITAFRTKPSFFNRIYDLISYLYYKAFMFKKDNNDLFRNLLLYSLIPLGLFLLYRILKDVKPYKQKDSRKNINPYKRIPELKIIDEKFRSKGLVPENETVGNWFKRLQNILSDSGNLNKIKKLYYKKRYGEYKLRTEEKKDFLNSLERVKKGE